MPLGRSLTLLRPQFPPSVKWRQFMARREGCQAGAVPGTKQMLSLGMRPATFSFWLSGALERSTTFSTVREFGDGLKSNKK